MGSRRSWTQAGKNRQLTWQRGRVQTASKQRRPPLSGGPPVSGRKKGEWSMTHPHDDGQDGERATGKRSTTQVNWVDAAKGVQSGAKERTAGRSKTNHKD